MKRDLGSRTPAVKDPMAAHDVQNALIDREIVALDPTSQSCCLSATCAVTLSFRGDADASAKLPAVGEDNLIHSSHANVPEERLTDLRKRGSSAECEGNSIWAKVQLGIINIIYSISFGLGNFSGRPRIQQPPSSRSRSKSKRMLYENPTD